MNWNDSCPFHCAQMLHVIEIDWMWIENVNIAVRANSIRSEFTTIARSIVAMNSLTVRATNTCVTTFVGKKIWKQVINKYMCRHRCRHMLSHTDTAQHKHVYVTYSVYVFGCDNDPMTTTTTTTSTHKLRTHEWLLFYFLYKLIVHLYICACMCGKSATSIYTGNIHSIDVILCVNGNVCWVERVYSVCFINCAVQRLVQRTSVVPRLVLYPLKYTYTQKRRRATTYTVTLPFSGWYKAVVAMKFYCTKVQQCMHEFEFVWYVSDVDVVVVEIYLDTYARTGRRIHNNKNYTLLAAPWETQIYQANRSNKYRYIYI